MFEPYRKAAGTEAVFESGIYNPGVGRWLGVKDGAIVLTTGSPISLSEYFPKANDAGTDKFAHELLDALKADNPPEGYRLEITKPGLNDCIICSFRGTRTRYIDTGMKIRRLEGRGVLFDIAGHPSQVNKFEHDYVRRHTNAIVTCLEARSAPEPERMIRVWHPN